jgi:hypothetical protein
MCRFLLGLTFALLLGAGSAFAQNPQGMSMRGGFRAPPPASVQRSNFPPLVARPVAPSSLFFGRGFIGYGGFGGYFGGNYYPSNYYDDDQPPPIWYVPPTHTVQLSGEFPGTLILEFPTTARVWLEGRELVGKPDSICTLVSPVLRPGQQHTFHVRARWEANGKTFEYTREAELGPGDRSKILVVSGTAVNEK